jgi:hypothetical protein
MGPTKTKITKSELVGDAAITSHELRRLNITDHPIVMPLVPIPT